jgi:Domain of unknown function (DUF4360)
MRKALYSLCAALGMAATALVAAPAQAIVLDLPVPPPNDKIVIDVVTINGSGCPAGSASIAMSPDNTAFTVTYSKYQALVGVGATTTDARKNCQINLVVHVPTGFTFAITSVQYRGYHKLAKGSTAVQRANYYFQGQKETAYASHTYSGPSKDQDFGDNWQSNDEVPIAALVWSPCGALRNLNINTELRVAAGSSDVKKTTSLIAMDSTDGEINTIYNFGWGRC